MKLQEYVLDVKKLLFSDCQTESYPPIERSTPSSNYLFFLQYEYLKIELTQSAPFRHIEVIWTVFMWNIKAFGTTFLILCLREYPPFT